jgi:hypothetical protein
LGGVFGAQAIADETWPGVTVTPTVSPNHAGTPRHPQGVHLTTTFHWASLGSSAQPIVTHFFVLFPKGSLYNGTKYPVCSLGKMDARGPSGCPAASIMGHGTGDAYADTTVTHPSITVINGGAHTVYFYTVLNNPARVQEPVVGHISRMGGKWAYALSVSVPQNLQVVAGVPIELTSLSVNAGRGTWLSTTGCGPGGRWPFSVTTSYLDPNTSATGASNYSATTACHR